MPKKKSAEEAPAPAGKLLIRKNADKGEGKVPDKAQPPKKDKTALSESRSVKKPASSVQEWLDRKNKEKRFAGKAQIKMAADVKTPFNLRRPTGILGLDIELGGGLHAGGMTEIFGEASVGKTFLAYTVAGHVQKNYGDNARILILSVEIRPDKGFARMADFCVAYGEDEIAEFNKHRQLRGMPAFTEEEKEDLRKQIGDVVIVTAETADVGFDVIVDALESGLFQLVIVESLGALLTKDVDEGSVGDAHYAGPSRIVTQFLNKALPLFLMDRPDGTMLETTVIGINQARANIGHSKYEPEIKAAMGAYAWKHGCLASISLERGSTIRPDPSAPAVGRTVKWKFAKGKAGTHDGKKGEYDYWHLPKLEPVFWKDVQENWYGGIARFNEMADTAKRMEVVSVAGSWVTFGKQRWQGMERFAQAISEDEELCKAVRDACIDKAGLLIRYT